MRKNTTTLNDFLDFISSDNPSAAVQSSTILTKAAGNNVDIISTFDNRHSFLRNILITRKLKRLIEKNNYQYHQVRLRCFLAYGESRKFSPCSREEIFFIFDKNYKQLKNFLVQCGNTFKLSGFILKRVGSDEAGFVDVK